MAASGLRNEGREAVERAGPAALMGAGLDLGLEGGVPQGKPCAVAEIGEGHGHQCFRIVAAVAFGVVGEDQAFGCRDFAIDAVLGHNRAARRAHAPPPDAARSHIHLAGQRGEAARRPPARRLGDIGPGGEHQLARRRHFALHDQLNGLCQDVHDSLWNSTSTTISMASPNSGGRPKSTGLMLPLALTPTRGRSAKPLPAPTSSTSNVTGLVLPIRVSWPSTLPRRVLICRNAVDTNVASGNAADFRKLLPASSWAKPLTLDVIDAVSTLAVSEALAVLTGSHFSVPLTRSKRKMLHE